jgi:hypothetical protein
MPSSQIRGQGAGQKKKEVGERPCPSAAWARAEDLTGMAVFLASDEAGVYRRPDLQCRWRTMDELMTGPDPTHQAVERHAGDLPDEVARPAMTGRLTPGIVHIGWAISTARIRPGICTG